MEMQERTHVMRRQQESEDPVRAAASTPPPPLKDTGSPEELEKMLRGLVGTRRRNENQTEQTQRL